MGIAIYVNGADFSSANLGQVTPSATSAELESISINGDSSMIGSGTLSIVYNPTNVSSAKKGVTWKLYANSACTQELSNTIANIDESGKVSISVAATQQNVYVKAVSIYNTSISATKSLQIEPKQGEWAFGYNQAILSDIASKSGTDGLGMKVKYGANFSKGIDFFSGKSITKIRIYKRAIYGGGTIYLGYASKTENEEPTELASIPVIKDEGYYELALSSKITIPSDKTLAVWTSGKLLATFMDTNSETNYEYNGINATTGSAFQRYLIAIDYMFE